MAISGGTRPIFTPHQEKSFAAAGIDLPTLLKILEQLAAAAPQLAEVALEFGPADYFSLMIFGLVGAVILARGSVVKAIGMILIGLLGLVPGMDSLRLLETIALAEEAFKREVPENLLAHPQCHRAGARHVRAEVVVEGRWAESAGVVRGLLAAHVPLTKRVPLAGSKRSRASLKVGILRASPFFLARTARRAFCFAGLRRAARTSPALTDSHAYAITSCQQVGAHHRGFQRLRGRRSPRFRRRRLQPHPRRPPHRPPRRARPPPPSRSWPGVGNTPSSWRRTRCSCSWRPD